MTVNGLAATLSRSSILLLLLVLTACGNVFRQFPDAGSRSYMLDRAQACIDDYDFDCAIENIEPIVEDDPSDAEAVAIAVTAFSGRGGLRVLDLVQEISNGLSSDNLFVILAEHFPQAGTSEREDVDRAVEILEAYGTSAPLRSDSVNVLAFFLYYGHVGVILSDFAYDGAPTVGAGFDSCDATDLPDEQVQDMGRALANLVEISNSLPSNSLISDTFSGFSSAITAMGLSKTMECPAATAQCKLVRSLAGNDMGGIGLGPDDTNICP